MHDHRVKIQSSPCCCRRMLVIAVQVFQWGKLFVLMLQTIVVWMLLVTAVGPTIQVLLAMYPRKPMDWHCITVMCVMIFKRAVQASLPLVVSLGVKFMTHRLKKLGLIFGRNWTVRRVLPPLKTAKIIWLDGMIQAMRLFPKGMWLNGKIKVARVDICPNPHHHSDHGDRLGQTNGAVEYVFHQHCPVMHRLVQMNGNMWWHWGAKKLVQVQHMEAVAVTHVGKVIPMQNWMMIICMAVKWK